VTIIQLNCSANARMIPLGFEPARGVRDPHHRDLASHVVEPDDSSRPASFDRHPAFQLHAEFGEEGDGGVEVVDDDADVVHALNRDAPRVGAGAASVAVTVPSRIRTPARTGGSLTGACLVIG
jgi:hypothetical protein